MPAEVVYIGADYPEYESLEEMVAAADSVAIVEFTGKSRVITIGVQAPANPDNPIENPSLGAPKNVNPPAPEPPPIAATAWEAVVVSRVAGRELPLTVSVQELGGTLDGVRYIAEHPGAPSISEGEALVFLQEVAPGMYALVNPDEGMMRKAGTGQFLPNETSGIVASPDEIATLVDE